MIVDNARLRINRWMAPQWPGALLLFVLAGIAVRIYSGAASAIVNPDAAAYIQQARAIYYGAWQDLESGSMSYITAYPVLIAAVNIVSGDWIVSARAVSIIFSSLTLIVLYPLARTFFSRDISLLVVLIYAFNPLFVTSGSDVIKDPGAWFFAVSGMLLFVRQLHAFSPIATMASGFMFVLAAWMRIEALVFLAGSAIYLLLAGTEKRWKKLTCFLSSLLVLGCLAFLALAVTHRSELLWARMEEFGPRIKSALHGYSLLRESLRELAANPPLGMPAEYFDQVRSITWLVGLGVVVRNAVEAYFIPFFALFLIGLLRTRAILREDVRGGYFLLLLGLLFLLFYVFIFSCWVLEQRWLGAAILASFFFIGHGLRIAQHTIQSRFGADASRAAAILAVTILVVTLPKSLSSREQDKTVFLDISQVIASGRTSKDEVINILAPENTIRWLSLYVNKKIDGAPDSNRFAYGVNIESAFRNQYNSFLAYLHTNNISYFLWSEKHWRKDVFDVLSLYKTSDLMRSGEWSHPDTGQMVLFKVQPLHVTEPE